jgi:hypothetical protein
MNDLTESARVSRAINSGQSDGSQRTAIGAGAEEPPSPYGAEIAQTAIQSVGMSTRDGWSPHMRPPDYALAVSLIFTKATNQAIILREPPSHVCSTSILWNSLAHDKRFEQVPMSEAAPGDIIIGSGWQQGADGYAGIVVDHGRIISNSSQGVQDNSSLVEIQRGRPEIAAFRYVGFWNYYSSKSLVNAGYNPSEPRLPGGQPGGGQWTSGGGGSERGVGQGDTNMGAEPTTERAAEAKKFADLAKVYSEKAKHEDQLAGPTAMAFDRVGQPDDQDRHKMAAKEARDIAEEMQRRAYILTHGTEDNYRKLVVDEYGINNPNLNEIMAYYAGEFNDQATLNYLKLQHPAAPPSPDQFRKDVGMLALLPQFEKMGAAAGESPLTEPPEKSIFDKATDIAAGNAGSSGEHPAASGNPSEKNEDSRLSSEKSSPNYKAIEYVPETSRMMDENAAAYQDGAAASRYGMAPRLSGVDLNGKISAKFDGVDSATGEMVDRKLNVVERPNFVKAALRQSAVAAQNGFTVRWEVPNEAVQAKAQRILSANGIKNIKVAVVPK